MRSRKPIAGTITKGMDQAAGIQRQLALERERHTNKTASIAGQRGAIHGISDPALRTAKLLKLRFDDTEERQRHKAKVAELQRRLRGVWK